MKRRFHVYSTKDGAFSHEVVVSEADLPKNLGPDQAAYGGDDVSAADYQCKRMDLGTGLVVEHRAPAPQSDAMATWCWSEEHRRWIAEPTEAAVAARVRAERDRRIAACSWIVERARDLDEPVPAEWLAYRQALRDVPAQPGFPRAVTWPTPPASA